MLCETIVCTTNGELLLEEMSSMKSPKIIMGCTVFEVDETICDTIFNK